MNKEERIKYIKKHEKQIIKNIKKDLGETIAFIVSPANSKTLEGLDKDVAETFLKMQKESNERIIKNARESLNLKRDIENRYKQCEIEPTGDEEIAFGVDIKKYLEEIRHLEDHEEQLILYIKDGQVIDKDKIVGKTYSINLNDEDYEKIFKKAHKLNASVLSCHNHPLSTYAEFSKGDITNANKHAYPIAKKYGIKLEDAVVSEDDYKKRR